MRSYIWRRISGAVAPGAAAAFFGSVSHGAQGRPDSPRPPRPGLRDATSLVDIDVHAVNRWAVAARRILPTLSGACRRPQNVPQRSPAAAARFRHYPSRNPAVQPIPAGAGMIFSRRRQRQHSPRRDVLPRREAGGRSRRVAVAQRTVPKTDARALDTAARASCCACHGSGPVRNTASAGTLTDSRITGQPEGQHQHAANEGSRIYRAGAGRR